jgi:hypothetical protein
MVLVSFGLAGSAATSKTKMAPSSMPDSQS